MASIIKPICTAGSRDACELLANTELPVMQIAFRLGYVDPTYFNRFITRQFGQSPGKYRHVLRHRQLSVCGAS